MRTSSFKDIAISGWRKGLGTVWELGKVVVPISVGLAILDHTQVLKIIAEKMGPVMTIFGLPGKAAMVLVLGYFLSIYAAIGGIISLSFTTREITILALMLSFAHTLIVEAAVCKKTGCGVPLILSLRIALSFLAGVFANILL